MTYHVDRWLGYQPWGVVNPWVFANYGQPQRHRGYVSPIIYQTEPPILRNHNLGGLGAAPVMMAARTASYKMPAAMRVAKMMVSRGASPLVAASMKAQQRRREMHAARTSEHRRRREHAERMRRASMQGLGQTVTDDAAARGARMEKIAITGLALSAASLGVYLWTVRKMLKTNPRKRSVRRNSSESSFRVGQRVQAHPGTDVWMMGDRYGDVVKIAKRTGTVHVKMDRSGKTRRFHPRNLMPV